MIPPPECLVPLQKLEESCPVAEGSNPVAVWAYCDTDRVCKRIMHDEDCSSSLGGGIVFPTADDCINYCGEEEQLGANVVEDREEKQMELEIVEREDEEEEEEDEEQDKLEEDQEEDQEDLEEEQEEELEDLEQEQEDLEEELEEGEMDEVEEQEEESEEEVEEEEETDGIFDSILDFIGIRDY